LLQPRRFPLLAQPRAIAQRRLVGADEAHRALQLLGHLLHQRGLAHLPRPGDHLQVAPWLCQPTGQLGGLWALVGVLRFTLHVE